MVSEAQIAANRRNATKSCGPKTEGGKQIARLNALSHGLTARIAMLPEEDVAEYEARREDFFEMYKPRNGVEVAQVERTAYLWWQLLRVGRAQSAQLCAHAHTAESETKAREAREFNELTHQLLMPGREARWGGSKITSSSNTAGEGQGAHGLREPGFQHPTFIVIRMEFQRDGCRWLNGQWSELSVPLDEGRAWQAVECFKAARLLGMQPESVIEIGDLAEFLRLCVALAGGQIELAKETWALLAPPDAEDGWELLRVQLELEGFKPDAESARQELRSIVRKQVERLAPRLERHEEVAEILEILGPDLHTFDSSPRGEKIRRYERDTQRTIDRLQRELRNRVGRSAEQFGPAYGAYRGMNPGLLKRTLASTMAIDSLAASREKEIACRRNEANGGVRGGVESVPVLTGDDGGRESLRGAKGDNEGGSDSSRSHEDFAPRRNEANGHGSGVATIVTEEIASRRNEANGHGSGVATIVTEEIAARRNEANGHGSGVVTVVTDEVMPRRNEANGLGARTDLAGDAQTEVIEKRQVGSATVTRFSLAAGVKGNRGAFAVSVGRGSERYGIETDKGMRPGSQQQARRRAALGPFRRRASQRGGSRSGTTGAY